MHQGLLFMKKKLIYGLVLNSKATSSALVKDKKKDF